MVLLVIMRMPCGGVQGCSRVVPDEVGGPSAHTGAVSAIDEYVHDLAAALRGPRRVRADLVAEARDGLVDAAEAYQATGVARTHAERQAVAEFGPVPELAASYQRLLAFAQGRRTAVLVFLVCAVQGLGSTFAWRTADMGWRGLPSPEYLVLANVVDWFGIGVKVLALLLLAVCGFGTRYLGTRRWVPRAIGLFALGIGLYSVVTSVVMTAADPVGSITDGYHLPWILVGGLLPLALVAPSARRCLSWT